MSILTTARTTTPPSMRLIKTFDREVVVIVDTQIAKMSGSRFFASESDAIVPREPVPEAAII